jgi:ribonuclease J
LSRIEAVESGLSVLPLGGCGEIGLNSTLLIHGRDALLVDCGILLGIPNAPGVDRAVPGFEPLHRENRRLAGVVLTHGHEDHIGALPALLADFDVPVFGTPLTIALARSRLEGRGRPIAKEARRQSPDRLVSVPLGGRVTAGPSRSS